MNRRNWLSAAALSSLALLRERLPHLEATETCMSMPFRHSVCRWCYSAVPLEELADRVKDYNIKSIELLKPEEWRIVQQRGLDCAIATADFIDLDRGFNNPANHQRLQQQYLPLIRKAAEAGIPQVICFSGARGNVSDEQGLEHCARGLAPLIREAEQRDIILLMELLNSKIDHPGHMCDRSRWGVQLVDKIGSTHFKLLYDIYHMQVMEGDIIATIRKYKDRIGHYHTAGVPGRHEIDNGQELNYPAIIRAIADTGFTGYLAQEFIPSRPERGLEKLAEAIKICGG